MSFLRCLQDISAREDDNDESNFALAQTMEGTQMPLISTGRGEIVQRREETLQQTENLANRNLVLRDNMSIHSDSTASPLELERDGLQETLNEMLAIGMDTVSGGRTVAEGSCRWYHKIA